MIHLYFSLVLAASLAIGAIGGDSKKEEPTCPTAQNVTATIIRPKEVVEYKHYLVRYVCVAQTMSVRILYVEARFLTLINHRLGFCITRKEMSPKCSETRRRALIYQLKSTLYDPKTCPPTIIFP